MNWTLGLLLQNPNQFKIVKGFVYKLLQDNPW